MSNSSRIEGEIIKQVSSAALAAHQQLYLDITIPTGGYLYTYVADESKVSNATSVYFDDFKIIHSRSASALQVVQTTDYYPFGLAMAAQSYQKQSSLDNDYLYNGKELQDEHNLGWLDYGARMYMSDIGRWGVVDPMADERDWLSPYQYVQNNPLLRIDPDGMFDIIDIEKSTGKITVTEAEGDDIVRMVDNGEVQNSYTYGENGSFNEYNIVQTNELGTVVTNYSQDSNKAEQFYEFAAQSDVEFAKVDVGNSDRLIASSIGTSHKPTIDPDVFNEFFYVFLKDGFEVKHISHSHPKGNSVPSGYYGYQEGNPKSLMPIEGQQKGDAQVARDMSKRPGFKNMTFDIYNPKTKKRTSYDGYNRANIISPK